jgi:hypothetical protein
MAECSNKIRMYFSVEIFDFKHFVRHFTLNRKSDIGLNKELKSYVKVSVVLRLETGNTSNAN